MSADRLRRVSAEMREFAEAADVPGPWEVGRRYTNKGDAIRPVDNDDGTVCEIYEGSAPDANEACERLARHIAAWSPPVALAVADWLDAVRARWSTVDDDAVFHALAVCDAWEGQ